jgi:hypothetical protein
MPFRFTDESGLDELQVVETDTELLDQATTRREEDDPLPVVDADQGLPANDDFESVSNWHMPEENELRNIISEMGEDSCEKAKKARRKRE